MHVFCCEEKQEKDLEQNAFASQALIFSARQDTCVDANNKISFCENRK